MRIFITGGTGFVGAHVIRRLTDANNEIIALARSESAAGKLREMGATPILGDMRNIDHWKAALVGCEVVIHCAAPVEFWGPWNKFESEIVFASKNLLQAASDAGVARFVHLSSESALQDSENLLGIDESHPYPIVPNSFYGAAKKQAEVELLKSDANIDLIILRPTFVWGSDSPALGEIAAKAKSGSFIWASNGNAAFEAVHVLNLAEAVFLAAQNGKGRKVYFVTDDTPGNVRDFFSDYFKSIGIDAPNKSLPNQLIKVLASVTERVWAGVGTKNKPPLTRFEWAFVGMSRKYNISKIKSDLSYQPIISRKQGFEQIKSLRNGAS